MPNSVGAIFWAFSRAKKLKCYLRCHFQMGFLGQQIRLNGHPVSPMLQKRLTAALRMLPVWSSTMTPPEDDVGPSGHLGQDLARFGD